MTDQEFKNLPKVSDLALCLRRLGKNFFLGLCLFSQLTEMKFVPHINKENSSEVAIEFQWHFQFSIVPNQKIWTTCMRT